MPSTSKSGMMVENDAIVEKKTSLVSPIITAHRMSHAQVVELYIYRNETDNHGHMRAKKLTEDHHGQEVDIRNASELHE